MTIPVNMINCVYDDKITAPNGVDHVVFSIASRSRGNYLKLSQIAFGLWNKLSDDHGGLYYRRAPDVVMEMHPFWVKCLTNTAWYWVMVKKIGYFLRIAPHTGARAKFTFRCAPKDGIPFADTYWIKGESEKTKYIEDVKIMTVYNPNVPCEQVAQNIRDVVSRLNVLLDEAKHRKMRVAIGANGNFGEYSTVVSLDVNYIAVEL